MIHLFRKIREIGVFANTSKEEIKRIRLLNVFCICWFCFVIIFSTVDLIFKPNCFFNILTHMLSFVVLMIVLFLQYFKQYFIARLLYVVTNALVFILFANLLETNSLMEYFLVITPMLSILFIDIKWVNWAILIISFLGFYIPIRLNGYYSMLNVNPVSNFILFFAVFIIVNYFKNLNEKNEKLLEQQRNDALNAKEYIEAQGKELAELYAFQNHFMVNLSHEIRTPLTLVKSGTNQLRKENTQAKTNELCDKIDQNSKKIKHLVDNIIDIAKMKSSKLEMQKKLFHVFPFVLKTIATFDNIFKEKNIDLKIEVIGKNENILVNGDKIYLERAIGNLIMNAQKYCSVGDYVTIQLSVENDIFKFEIIDTGCGIVEEDLGKIFLPFYRAQNSINQAGGSGVGLPFAKEVVLLHGGEVFVESKLEQGSIFTVTIPCLESEKILIEQSVTTNNSLKAFENTKILLVEDNIEMQEYLKSLLLPFEVRVAYNGRFALELLQSFNPEMIITDYMMPEMDGYNFVKEVKKLGIECPVIVLTARMDVTAKLDFLRLGIDDYLTKPFNEEELFIRIENSLKNNLSRIIAVEENQEDDVQLDEFEQEAKSLVIKNLSSVDFGVSELAHQLSITERTLNRKLKLINGLTPNSFIREIKLNEAKRMLDIDDKISLKEITYNLGFKNSTHFSTLFEKRFGKKPIVKFAEKQ